MKRIKQFTSRMLAVMLAGTLAVGSVSVSAFGAEDAGSTAVASEEFLFDEATENSMTEATTSEVADEEVMTESSSAETVDEEVMSETSGVEEALEAGVTELPDGTFADTTQIPAEEETVTSYTVTLDANGGYFANEWDDSISDYVEQAEVVVKQIPVGEPVTAVPTNTDQEGHGMTFAGWSLERDGETITTGDEEYTPVENCVLYAVWKSPETAVESEKTTWRKSDSDSDSIQDTALVDNGTAQAETANLFEDTEEIEETPEEIDDISMAEGTDESFIEEDDFSDINNGSETEGGNVIPDQQYIVSDQEVNYDNKERENTSNDNSDIAAAEKETQSVILESSEEGETETAREDASMNVVESGTCGDNLNWYLDEGGTFTISGTGAMYDYNYTEDSPWNEKTIKKIIIGEGVSSIGSASFHHQTSLTSITIPEGVKSIGWEAFSGCTNLTTVSIPRSVVCVGAEVFAGTAFLDSLEVVNGFKVINGILLSYTGEDQNVIVPNGVTIIADRVFRENTTLTSISFPTNMTRIGEWAFFGCTNLSTVNMPTNLLSIGEEAFSRCENLITISIPSGVTCIDSGVFEKCTNLTNIVLPDELKSIGSSAFSQCINLTEINIPSTVTEIGYGAFYACKNLTSIIIPNGVTLIDISTFRYCSALTNVIIPQGVTNIGKSAFEGCISLTEVIIPSSVISIKEKAFYNCTSLVNVTVPVDLTDIATNAFAYTPWYNSYETTTGFKIINGVLFNYSGDGGEVVIPSSVKIIGASSFVNCSNVISVRIPSSVKSIEKNAFSYCSNLTTVEIPSSITSIETGVFSNCTSLSNVTIPSSVISIGGSAFYGCSGLKKVTLSSNLASIESNAFYGCSSLANVTIPSGVTSIGYGAFENCSSIKSLTLTNSINSIGERAFINCSSLLNITIPGSIESIGTDIFKDCTSLTSLTIQEGVKSIGYCSFMGCTSLKSVTLPSTLTSIGNMSFRNCTSLESISIPKNVSSITTEYANKNGVHASFAGAENLSEIVVNSNNSTYKEYDGCLYNSDLTELLYCPEGKESLIISPSTKIINQDALRIGSGDSVAAGSKLKNIYFATCSPSIPETFTFYDLTATAYYNNLLGNWPEDKRQNYDGTITWVEKPLNITDCTMAISPTSYYYDGTAKKPTVTIKYNGTTLTSNTDYTVSYSNNINAGTGTVTATGKGHFTGTISKTFTINKATPTLSFASSSVSKKTTDSAFTNTFTKKTDGAVTFSSSNTSVATVNSSSGLVTIKGAGNTTITANAAAGTNYNAGSVSYTLTVTKPVTNAFQWGRDNWNFTNSRYDGFSSGQYISQINSSYVNRLKANLTNNEFRCIFDLEDGWIYDDWGGSCYGMSSLVHLAHNGYLPYANYKSGASRLYDLDLPKNNSNVSSLVTYYQMLQVKGVIQQQYRTVPTRSNRENIENIINLLSSNYTVLLGFKKTGWGGHAILAYDVEYGSYTWNGITYQGCIKICDPNNSRRYDERYNIYFNTNSYNWAIPAYYSGGILSTRGATFNYVGANTGDINEGGYLSGSMSGNNSDFVARLDAYEISENRNIRKVRESNGNYNTVSGGSDDIVEDYSFISTGNNDEGVIGYNLYDSDSAYKVSQDSPDKIKLRMDYGNCYLEAESQAANSVIFDKKGYISIESESAGYNMAMTFNEDYPTDWFTLEVSGTGANEASLTKQNNGYLLTSDNLTNIQVDANNREEDVHVYASTSEQEVFICEKDGMLDVKADLDHNGTFETSVSGKANISKAVVTSLASETYNGSPLTPLPEVKMNGWVLKQGTDYTVNYKNNVNVGTATVVITGIGNYEGVITESFTINKAIQSIKASNLTLTFLKTATITASGNKGKLSYKSDNTSVAIVDATGKVTAKGVGTTTVSISAAATSNYNAAMKAITVKVSKATQSITAKAAASSVAVGKTTTVSITGNKGAKSFKSSDTTIATVDSKTGKVTAKKVGTVKITATSAATANYNAASKTVTIKVVPAATASLKADNQATGIKLTWKKVTGANGYKVYRGSTLIKTITSGSTVTFADTKANTNGTKYTYKVVAKAATGDSTLSKSVAVYRVARPAVSSVTNSAASKMTVKWGKNAKATGYQIQYSTDKTFKAGNKAVTAAGASAVSKVIGGLTKSKTYYVRIRMYKTVGSAKYWSVWSAAKSVKIVK